VGAQEKKGLADRLSETCKRSHERMRGGRKGRKKGKEYGVGTGETVGRRGHTKSGIVRAADSGRLHRSRKKRGQSLFASKREGKEKVKDF